MNRLRLLARRSAEKRVIRGAHAKAVAALPAGHPLHAPVPAEVGGGSLFNRSDATGQPRFTPRPPAVTMPIAGLAPTGAGPRAVRPYVPTPDPLEAPDAPGAQEEETRVFEFVAAAMPLAGFLTPEEAERLKAAPARDSVPPEFRVPLDSRALLYCGPGWTQTLTAARILEGWWEDPQAGLDRIATRTAAGFTTARGHVRETLAGAWRAVREQSASGAVPGGDGEMLP